MHFGTWYFKFHKVLKCTITESSPGDSPTDTGTHEVMCGGRAACQRADLNPVQPQADMTLAVLLLPPYTLTDKGKR